MELWHFYLLSSRTYKLFELSFLFELLPTLIAVRKGIFIIHILMRTSLNRRRCGKPRGVTLTPFKRFIAWVHLFKLFSISGFARRSFLKSFDNRKRLLRSDAFYRKILIWLCAGTFQSFATPGLTLE
jgi:hypothetical protein